MHLRACVGVRWQQSTIVSGWRRQRRTGADGDGDESGLQVRLASLRAATAAWAATHGICMPSEKAILD